jgi:hypothetical protein
MKTYIAKVGGNLSDGTEFKAGETISPTAKDLKELLKMDAVEVVGEDEESEE